MPFSLPRWLLHQTKMFGGVVLKHVSLAVIMTTNKKSPTKHATNKAVRFVPSSNIACIIRSAVGIQILRHSGIQRSIVIFNLLKSQSIQGERSGGAAREHALQAAIMIMSRPFIANQRATAVHSVMAELSASMIHLPGGTQTSPRSGIPLKTARCNHPRLPSIRVEKYGGAVQRLVHMAAFMNMSKSSATNPAVTVVRTVPGKGFAFTTRSRDSVRNSPHNGTRLGTFCDRLRSLSLRVKSFGGIVHRLAPKAVHMIISR